MIALLEQHAIHMLALRREAQTACHQPLAQTVVAALLAGAVHPGDKLDPKPPVSILRIIPNKAQRGTFFSAATPITVQGSNAGVIWNFSGQECPSIHQIPAPSV
jgi:hypothetical protein